MEYESGRMLVRGLSCFNIAEILECGQCFNHLKLGEGDYRVVAAGNVVRVRQSPDTADTAEFFCPEDSFPFWRRYFDLCTDYAAVRDRLGASGDVLGRAVTFSPGIRHLRQDTFECLISYIISANNRIPMIMACVEKISRKYGREIGEGVYAFPTAAKLAEADEQGLRDCKVGFRAKYIMDAVWKVQTGQIEINPENTLTTDDLRANLKQIKGVGDKVADCVMLCSYGRREVFPTDVWIIRAIRTLFFGGEERSLKEIHSFAGETFGSDAGMANQYIFNYARLSGICGKVK